MSKFSYFLILVLVLIFSKECGAIVQKAPIAPSDFFEREMRQETTAIKTVRIANNTDWKIFCIVICGNEIVSESIKPGEFLRCQIKNLYNYNLPVHCRVKIVILATDCQGKLITIANKEIRIDFSGPSSREEILIILSDWLRKFTEDGREALNKEGG